MAEETKRNWLVSGGTGFIGRELIYRLLVDTPDNITLLSRKSPDYERSRLHKILQCIDPTLATDWKRLKILRIDLNRPNLGVCLSSFSKLKHYEHHFIHLAASTRFTNRLEQARAINVTGVKNAFGLAEKLHQSSFSIRFHHVSTAYVHGNRKGIVYATDTVKPELTRNSYEQSKAEAECWIRQQQWRIPTTIFRPSIVVGDSNTGRASGTPTIYWAVKMILMGHKRFFARPDARLDMVPVNYVVSAILALATRKSSVGQCFPLVAGEKKDQTLENLARAVETALVVPRPVLHHPFIPLHFSGATRLAATLIKQERFAEQMLAYLPYFSENPRFDNEPTATALKGSEITVPEFDTYSDILLRSFADREHIRAVTPERFVA